VNKAVWLAKRNYWIAAIGAIVSVVSFFVSAVSIIELPFLNISESFSLPNFGPGAPTAPSPSGFNIPVSALVLASNEGILWVSLLLVLVVLGVSLVFLVRQNPFGSRASVQTQARWTALGFVVAGVLSAVCLIASLLLVQQHLQDLVQNVMGTGLGSSLSNLFQFNFTWAIGAYLFLAGLVTIVVAGMMEIISPVKMQSNAEMAAPVNSPQNLYNYPPPMSQGGPPFADSHTRYGGNPASDGQSYPTVPSQQPPTGPYQQ
jgi:hypothetical protein